MSSKVHFDYTWTNMKVNNSHLMINILGKTFPERSQNVGTDLTLWESSDNVLQTLCVSWEYIHVKLICIKRIFLHHQNLRLCPSHCHVCIGVRVLFMCSYAFCILFCFSFLSIYYHHYVTKVICVTLILYDRKIVMCV